MKCSPQDGGCWYCHTKDDNLVFCWEFDTYIHEACAKRAITDDPEDREAQIICRELFKQP